jgi:two-component sensor histidine kinase
LAGQPASSAVDAGAYLQRVIDGTTRLDTRKGSVQVVYELSDGIQLDSERTTALALLACEAITNSLKHAHPSGVAGEIRVVFRRLGAECLLVIEDDGVGLPEGFSASADGGLGFRTIRGLCQQLNARLTYQSTPLGLRTEVLFAL